MRARIATTVITAVLMAAPVSQAQMGGARGGWVGHNHQGGNTFVLPNPFPTPGIQPLIVSPFANQPSFPRHRHFGDQFPAVAIPIYYPATGISGYYPDPSISGYESYQDLAYARAYSNGSALQVVTGSDHNPHYPSRESLLERRLDEQEMELDRLKRERNAAVQSKDGESEDLQPATILVFKGKRSTELVHNYAIVGSNLYVMGRNHRRIPLVDLDLLATARANEEAGLEFKMPGTPPPQLKSGLGINR